MEYGKSVENATTGTMCNSLPLLIYPQVTASWNSQIRSKIKMLTCNVSLKLMSPLSIAHFFIWLKLDYDEMQARQVLISFFSHPCLIVLFLLLLMRPKKKNAENDRNLESNRHNGALRPKPTTNGQLHGITLLGTVGMSLLARATLHECLQYEMYAPPRNPHHDLVRAVSTDT